MKRILSVLLLSVVATAAAFAQAQQQGAGAKPAETLPTVDQILDKYVQALGGKDALMKTNSSVSKGTFDLPAMGVSAPVEIYAKAPNKNATIIDIPGYGVVKEGFDGTVAWAMEPASGLREKTGAELAATKRGSEFHSELKFKELYKTVEVKGKQKVGDRDTYLVVATPAEGAPDKYYFDAQTGLIARLDQVLETPMGQVAFESYFDGYKDVNGIKVPFVIRRSSPAIEFTIRLTSVEFNVPVEDSKFAKPTT